MRNRIVLLMSSPEILISRAQSLFMRQRQLIDPIEQIARILSQLVGRRRVPGGIGLIRATAKTPALAS